MFTCVVPSDYRMLPMTKRQEKLSDSVKETGKGGGETKNNGKENAERGKENESEGRGKENVNENNVREKRRGSENEKEQEKRNEVEDAPEHQFRDLHLEIGTVLLRFRSFQVSVLAFLLLL